MTKFPGVTGSLSAVFTGTGVFVDLRMDFEGLRSFDGVNVFRSDFEFVAILATDCGMTWPGYGEKLTRFDCRVEGTPAEPFTEKGDGPGV